MSVAEDHAVCDVVFNAWKDRVGECRTIIACSPSDIELKRLRTIFPHAAVAVMGRDSWDLGTPYKGQPVDLITACNVFMYAPSPAIWFKHVLAACRWFWMQDVFCRYRGTNREFGRDGDAARYGLGGASAAPATFNLSLLGDRLVDYRCYDAGSFAAKRTLVNFVAMVRGIES